MALKLLSGPLTLGKGGGLRIASSGFSPRSISGLKAWYEADYGLLDGSGNPITADGTAIATWQDRSTNAYHLTQATAGKRPTYKTNISGSQPAALFSGGQALAKAFTPAVAQPNVLYLVMKTTSGAATPWITDGLPSADRHAFGFPFGATTPTINAGSSVNGSAYTQPDSTFNIWRLTFNGASSSAIRNNTTTYVSGNAGTNTLAGITLGSHSGQAANFFTGYVHALLAVNSPSATDTSNIEAYLKAKYGTP